MRIDLDVLGRCLEEIETCFIGVASECITSFVAHATVLVDGPATGGSGNLFSFSFSLLCEVCGGVRSDMERGEGGGMDVAGRKE